MKDWVLAGLIVWALAASFALLVSLDASNRLVRQWDAFNENYTCVRREGR